MIGFLLDTNVISEMRRIDRDERVVRWFDSVSQRSTFVSAISLGEIRNGIELLPESRKRIDLEGWLVGQVIPRFDGRIIAFTAEIADRWGRLEAERRRGATILPTVDAMIAATALHHDLTVVTRNEADFARSGARVFNPWSAPNPSSNAPDPHP